MLTSERSMQRLGQFQEGESVNVDDTYMVVSMTGRVTQIKRSMRFIDGKPVRGSQVLSMTIECEGLRDPLVITKENVNQFFVQHQKE